MKFYERLINFHGASTGVQISELRSIYSSDKLTSFLVMAPIVTLKRLVVLINFQRINKWMFFFTLYQLILFLYQYFVIVTRFKFKSKK